MKNNSSCFEKMWRSIIRPERHIYEISQLGPNVLTVEKTVTKRLDLELINKRKLHLQCSLFEPVRVMDKPHPCVIYLHGNSGSRVEALSVLGFLVPQNVSLCCLDLSGCGLSEGEYVTLGQRESEDVLAIIEFLRTQKPFITSLGLWGRSMGAVTAIFTGLQSEEIKILVCDSAFSNLRQVCNEYAVNRMRVPSCCFGIAFCFIRRKIFQIIQFEIESMKITEQIKKLSTNINILFLAAKQDELINPKHSELLFKSFQGQAKQIITFEGTHNSQRPAEILSLVSSFLIDCFGKEAWAISQRQQLIPSHNSRQLSVNKISFVNNDETQPMCKTGKKDFEEQKQ